jgi:O-antigen/teichoic acid export membrane protein
MAGLGRRATILALSRFANFGLMLVSPIVLVRLLSVGDFGRYREFLVYGSVLQYFAAFSVNDSLLYFMPRYPASIWRVVRQAALLVACTSAAVVLVAAITDALMAGALFGGFRLPVAVYILLFVNVDFWEAFFLARDEPLKMFAYTGGRLVARMLVVVGLAAATGDVWMIIWGLVGLEAARITLAGLFWRLAAHEKSEPRIAHLWREELQFCVPTGIAVILAMANLSMANIVVAKVIGAAALAQFTIGLYGEPIIGTLRNSISNVLLPEMVRIGADDSKKALLLWKQGTVVICLLLFPCAVLAFHFAEELVVTVFGANYRPAVPLLQIYVLAVLRSCFDFSPPLRAINKTRPLLYANLATVLVSAACLWILVPRYGTVGAMWSCVMAAFVESLYLGAAVLGLYGISARELVPWKRVLSVAVASAVACLVLVPGFWVNSLGFFGVLLASALYVSVFVIVVLVIRIPEAWSVLYRARRFALAMVP